jgi:hypothetical protein
MELKHLEGGGGDHVTVSVEVPNNEDFYPVNFIPGEQEIAINYAAVMEEFYVSVWNFGEKSEMFF